MSTKQAIVDQVVNNQECNAGEYYADFDSGSECWGVFHTEGDGFCYALFTSCAEAETYATNKNHVKVV